MEDEICLDTDILADFLRDKPYAIEWIKQNQKKTLATTVINMFELYYGAYKSNNSEKNFNSVNELKNQLLILDFDDRAAQRAAKIFRELEKNGKIIDIKDILIGSVVLVNDFSFKTNNKKDFERIKELRLCDDKTINGLEEKDGEEASN